MPEALIASALVCGFAPNKDLTLDKHTIKKHERLFRYGTCKGVNCEHLVNTGMSYTAHSHLRLCGFVASCSRRTFSPTKYRLHRAHSWSDTRSKDKPDKKAKPMQIRVTCMGYSSAARLLADRRQGSP